MSENLEAILASGDLAPATDEGIMLAMTWLADGLCSEAMPFVAVAALACLVDEALRRGLVESAVRETPDA